MTTRAKASLADAITFLAIAVALFSFMATALAQHATRRDVIIVAAAILIAAQGARFAYLRRLRCPSCGVRFGAKMYSVGLVVLPRPRNECWNWCQHVGSGETTRAIPPGSGSTCAIAGQAGLSNK